MKKINNLIDLLKRDLKVNPLVKASDKNLYDSETKTLYFKTGEIDLNTIFYLAHEFRHAYQDQYSLELLKNYKEREALTLEEYNLQPAEIDANAYARYFVNKYINPNVVPLFNGLSDKVKFKIKERRELFKV